MSAPSVAGSGHSLSGSSRTQPEPDGIEEEKMKARKLLLERQKKRRNEVEKTPEAQKLEEERKKKETDRIAKRNARKKAREEQKEKVPTAPGPSLEECPTTDKSIPAEEEKEDYAKFPPGGKIFASS
jgi:Na+-translocating ferredoxin:NAD+ oxidoreductase RnfC subunit